MQKPHSESKLLIFSIYVIRVLNVKSLSTRNIVHMKAVNECVVYWLIYMSIISLTGIEGMEKPGLKSQTIRQIHKMILKHRKIYSRLCIRLFHNMTRSAVTINVSGFT